MLAHVIAIRGMALPCQLPLQEFWKKMEICEASLGLGDQAHAFTALGIKQKWAINFGRRSKQAQSFSCSKTNQHQLIAIYSYFVRSCSHWKSSQLTCGSTYASDLGFCAIYYYRKHVFNDLRPYVCISEVCRFRSRTFSDRAPADAAFLESSRTRFKYRTQSVPILLQISWKKRRHLSPHRTPYGGSRFRCGHEAL